MAKPSLPGAKRRGRPPQNPWVTALSLAQTVSDQYALTEAEQSLAFKTALVLRRGAIIVELGVMYGRTAIILASAAKLTGAHYHGIDNFKMGSSLAEVEANLTKLDLQGQIHRGDTYTIRWSKPIDYLLIDAGHDEMNMRQDTARWLPLINPGGLVLFHAYNPDIDFTDPHFPVKRYADERTLGWTQIAYIPNLLIKQKPLT
ncbi:hypothetical protein A2W24_02365 [Microgenomates group bacterium RBG_16_45_19]|nr:MAG: hypothetical protein A2W24_02365 [Microgenomates group bacterium RBG_16_45_19]